MNGSIRNLNGENSPGSESLFVCYSCRCAYPLWWPLTTRIVTFQRPSSRDAVLVTRYPTPLIPACLNPLKLFYHNKTYLQWICELNWQLWCCFSYQWLVEFPINSALFCTETMMTRARLRHTLYYLTPVICSLIKPAALEKWGRPNPHCHFIINYNTLFSITMNLAWRFHTLCKKCLHSWIYIWRERERGREKERKQCVSLNVSMKTDLAAINNSPRY